MQEFSMLLFVMEMQMNTAIKSITVSPEYLTLKRLTEPMADEDLEKPEHSYFAGNSVKG